MNPHSQQEQHFLTAYEEYNDAIFRFCLVKTGDRDLALDITQEVFVKTWEYIAHGNVIDNIRAFLYQVARNQIIDYHRKKKPVSLDALLADGTDFGTETMNRTQEIIDGQFALDRIQKLKKKDQDVVIMRVIQDMSIADIATILGEKENTVSVRLHRALKKLEQILDTPLSSSLL